MTRWGPIGHGCQCTCPHAAPSCPKPRPIKIPTPICLGFPCLTSMAPLSFGPMRASDRLPRRRRAETHGPQNWVKLAFTAAGRSIGHGGPSAPCPEHPDGHPYMHSTMFSPQT